MEQRNLTPKEIIFGLLFVAILITAYSSIELGYIVIGIIALFIVASVIFFEHRNRSKKDIEKMEELERKSVLFKLSNFIQITLFIVIACYIFWAFTLKGS